MSGTAVIASGPASLARMVCVFWLEAGCYALDATLVGEVSMIDGLTPLPRCHPAVLGLGNLRGQALAVVDLAAVLGVDGPAASAPETAVRVLVLRLPGRSAGALVKRVEGVFTTEPDGFRTANRLAEPPYVAGFHTFAARPELVATAIAPAELAARLATLAFLRPAHRGG
jgi:chemotaxis signal transduction protein